MISRNNWLRFASLGILMLAAPVFAANDNSGARYYVSLGNSLSVGIQPRFLHAHKDKVALVTIDIGANDFLSADCIEGTAVDFACIQGAFSRLAVNLATILSALREVAHPETRIVGMNYYNTFDTSVAWRRAAAAAELPLTLPWASVDCAGLERALPIYAITSKPSFVPRPAFHK